MRSDLFFTDTDQWWKYETEQDLPYTIVDDGNSFNVTGLDCQEQNTVLDVSTFRRGLITRNIHKGNDDSVTTKTHREYSHTSNSTPYPVGAKGRNIVRKKNTKKDYFCPQCPRAYSYERSLKRHLKYECGKACKFACPYCQKQTKLIEDCHRHVRARHKGQPVYADELY